MLSPFDWMRRCDTGAELLATLRILAERPPLPEGLGPPSSALDGPCRRCWVYPRRVGGTLCPFCHAVMGRSPSLSRLSRRAVVIWSYLSRVPWEPNGQRPKHSLAAYIHDSQHGLLMLERWQLKPWLQELALHHGLTLQGVLQIFPTMGHGPEIGMGDILTRAVHQEAYLPHDKLWVRFYSQPHQIVNPHRRDQSGLLTFAATEFLSLLGMVEVFRAVLRPEEQQELQRLLIRGDSEDQSFYWGRFVGGLDQRARDMLDAWEVRRWPSQRIRLLYELVDYVAPPAQP